MEKIGNATKKTILICLILNMIWSTNVAKNDMYHILIFWWYILLIFGEKIDQFFFPKY